MRNVYIVTSSTLHASRFLPLFYRIKFKSPLNSLQVIFCCVESNLGFYQTQKSYFCPLSSCKLTSLHYNVNHFVNSTLLLQISELSFHDGKKNIKIFMLHLNFRLAETDFHKIPSHYHHVFKVFKYFFVNMFDFIESCATFSMFPPSLCFNST